VSKHFSFSSYSHLFFSLSIFRCSLSVMKDLDMKSKKRYDDF
jgi:hypothetical protein